MSHNLQRLPILIATLLLTLPFSTKPMELLALKSTKSINKTCNPKELSDYLNTLFRDNSQSYDSIKKLIKEKNINVNVTDEDGNTALHFAAQNSYNNVIKLLVSLGADIEAKAQETIKMDWQDVKDDPRTQNKGITKEEFEKNNSGFYFAKNII